MRWRFFRVARFIPLSQLVDGTGTRVDRGVKGSSVCNDMRNPSKELERRQYGQFDIETYQFTSVVVLEFSVVPRLQS